MAITIRDKAPRVHYQTFTSGQTVFQVPFEFMALTDLRVFVNEVEMVPVAAPATDASQYSATGVGITGGGSITFGPPGRKVNDKVIIFRDMPIDSPAELPTSGVFPVASLNSAFDETIAMVQQTEVNVQQRSLSLSDDDFTLALNRLPRKDARAGRMLAFDFNGQPIAIAPGDFGALSGGGSGGTGLFGLIWTGDAAPPPPWVDGQLWWQSSTGHLMLYYGDVDSGQWVQINIGTGTLASGPTPSADAHVRSTLLTAVSGTWVKPNTARWYRLRGVGAGGGGGGVQTNLNEWAAGSGGGSGGYGESEWFDATLVSGGTYTVGRGGQGGVGATSGATGGPTTFQDGFRSFTWSGGGGGRGHSGSASAWSLMGGAPGGLTGPFLIVAGNDGGNAYSSPVVMIGGRGGDSPIGVGGNGVQLSSGSAGGGNAVRGYGGGGGGAVRSSSSTPVNMSGGDGQIGAIYVEVMF